MNVKDVLKSINIVPDPLKDQFFLQDEEIIKRIVESADLNQDDVVLEVGTGIGNLTRELAKKAGKVIAFEIDPQFKPILSSLPSNVELHFESAWDFVKQHGKFRKKKEYNKVIANPPYSFIEPFLHNLTFVDYDKVILMIPEKFLKKIDGFDVFDSFFQTNVVTKVPKDKFYPVPKTNSVIIDLIKLPDPVANKNLGLFLRQYMYQHEPQLVKNSLTEGLIKYARFVFAKKLTKNQARQIINDANIPQELLNLPPDNASIYQLVEKNLKNDRFP